MQIIRHWHSFVEIETTNGSYIIDPFINGNTKCDVTIDDMLQKKIRGILLTHGHWDHLGETIAIHRWTKAPVICEYWLANWLEHEHSVVCVAGSLWGTVHDGDISVKFFSAPHGWWVLDNSNAYKCMSAWLLITIEWKTFYHAWDTALTYDMKLLGEFHKVDAACVPIWDIYTMWVVDGARAVWFIKPGIVFPVHYDTREILRVDAVEWARLVMQDTKSVPKVLKPWQYIVLE